MQNFSEKDITQLQMNPFQMISKDWMFVTSGNEEKANSLTASWGGLGTMWGKNVVFVFIRDSRYTKEFMDKEGTFSLSFPSEQYRDALNYIGKVSGRDGDKYEKAGISVAYEDGIPYIQESEMIFLCKTMSLTPIKSEEFLDDTINDKWYASKNYHNMYIAEIKKVLVNNG